MSLELLPPELLLSLTTQFPCREAQVQYLAALIHPSRPSPSTLVLYGPPATAKSTLLRTYLEETGLKHAVVRCRECVTGRQLLETAVGAVRDGLARTQGKEVGGSGGSGRCENLGVLVVRLQGLLGGMKEEEKFVLVFDGVDEVRETPGSLVPALARLGEFVPNLTTVLIVRHPSPRFLHKTGVPHVLFPAYTREQSIHILAQDPPDIFLQPPPDDENYDEDVHTEDKAWLWPRFCAAVWDSLAQSAARDLGSFREVCLKLWRPFLSPVIKGDFGTRDFSRLVVAQRKLFQDESVLLDSIIAAPSAGVPEPSVAAVSRTRAHDELPYYAKWLLVAAYLASFNPARMDVIYFMKTTDRKRRKKGGAGGRPSQNRKVPRHLLAASAFSIDRLLAILHAILPHDLRTTIDVYTQIATLSSLRLLVRTAGLGGHDPLEPGGKWRVGTLVTWEYALAVARSLDFNMSGYVAE